MIIKYLLLKHFKRFPLRELTVFEHTFNSKLLLIIGSNGCGKAQPLNSFIKVPNGWDLMGNMKIGTKVIAKDGTITKVNGVFPQGKKEVFKITFKDGRSTRATADHLWKVYLSDKYPIEPKVITTLDLINIININKTKKINKTFIWVDLPESEQNKDKNLFIDPYILGVIIGDGCLQGSIVITHPDEFIMNKINNKLKYGLMTSVHNNKNKCLTYCITHGIKGKPNYLIKKLENYGLMNTKSYERFIPEEYLYGSTKQRLELLQGLMDTDGTITSHGGTSSYCTTSFKLAYQIQYLVRSLGGIASISIRNTFYTDKNGEKIECKIAYQINIRYKKPSKLFTLPRKKEKTNDKNQYSSNLKISIQSIELDSFEETQCISIDHPDKLYITDNFIVTHNSSLVNELTPLPADRNNFNKNGYKEIHIEKDKQLFKLISDFTDSVKYYFYLNDENLNASNNITTQKDLVEKYFNISPSIHELLTGAETFTDMSLLNRKKLFSSITHLNIDFIIDNYNTLKEELKNNEFLLKTQMSLSQAEEQKLVNKDHLDNLFATQKQTKDYIDTLLSIRTDIYKYKINTSLDVTYSNYKELLIKYNDILSKYYIYLTAFPIDDVPFYKSKIEVIDFKLSNLYTQLENKQQETNILNLNKEHNLQSLKQKSLQLSFSKDKLLKSLIIYKELSSNLDELRNNIYKLEISLPEILRNIPLNLDKKYTKEKYDDLLSLKSNLLNELNELIPKELSIIKELTHINSHKQDITCPNCEHTWLPIDIDTKLKELKKEISIILERKIYLQNTIEITNKSIIEITEYFSIYKQYHTLRNITLTYLKPFWDIVDNEQYILHSPETIIGLLKTLSNDIITIEQYINIDCELKTLDENIEILSTLKDTNISNLQTDIININEDIYSLQSEKNTIQINIANNEIANKVNTILNSARIALERSRNDLFDSNVSFTVEEILSVIETELSKYKIILIETEKELNNYNNIKYTLEKYSKQIEDIQSNIKVLNIILDELSPKNGLIAKSVSSFLNIIISNINNIINSVWEYKMILKAINVEDEVLNYKFKVEVEDNLTIDDISKVSAGMKKLINFSFVLVLYKLLKLENYPLFLDEFSTNLDKNHKERLEFLINDISKTDRFSQIFLISHDKNYIFLKDFELIELI